MQKEGNSLYSVRRNEKFLSEIVLKDNYVISKPLHTKESSVNLEANYEQVPNSYIVSLNMK